MISRPWLIYALVTTAFWGVWGAFTGLPANYGFPETLIYCVWALTMIPPALYALRRVGWRLQFDARSITYGLLIGLLGAGGQMLLFHAVRIGPTYLIFPIISLSPVVTIVMSLELAARAHRQARRAGHRARAVLAATVRLLGALQAAAALASCGSALALGVLIAWGVQGFFMKLANATMSAESIFFYMTVSGLLLVPVAVCDDRLQCAINWGPKGPWLAAGIQILNAVGALTLVYAFRYGKAIVVSPLTNAGAPLITAVLAIVLLGAVPTATKIAGIVLALAGGRVAGDRARACKPLRRRAVIRMRRAIVRRDTSARRERIVAHAARAGQRADSLDGGPVRGLDADAAQGSQLPRCARRLHALLGWRVAAHRLAVAERECGRHQAQAVCGREGAHRPCGRGTDCAG